MQKNIGVCCYTGRQIDLRISAPKAGTARLTFQVGSSGLIASFGVHHDRVSCSRGGFHNRVWVSIQGQCQIALSRPAQLDESCHGQPLMSYDARAKFGVQPASGWRSLKCTSAAVDRDSLPRSANRRRQWAADVPCARSRHRPVGLGRREGPAAGLGGYSLWH